MMFNVAGRDVEVVGYDEYLRNYETVVKDKYKDCGEWYLVNELEEFDIRHESRVC